MNRFWSSIEVGLPAGSTGLTTGGSPTSERYRSLWAIAVILWAFLPGSAAAISVSVVKPNGGECLTVGQPYTIEVTMSGDTNHVALYYKTDGSQPTPATGAGPNDLDDSVIAHPLNATTFNWAPSSGHIAETGRIWVEAHNSNHYSANVWDQSNANFSVRSSCATGGVAPATVSKEILPPSGFGDPAEFLGVIPSFTYARLQFKSHWESGEYRIWLVEDRDGFLYTVAKQEIYLEKGQTVEFRLDGLIPDTFYGARYRIRGYEFSKGFESVLSQPSIPFRTISPVPPGQVERIFVIPGEDETLLSWVNPPDSDFLDVIIRRRLDRFAETLEDGILVFRGNSPYFTDEALQPGVKYYYSIFSVDRDNNYSLPVKISLTPEDGLPDVPLSPFEGKFQSTSTAFRISQPSSQASSTSAKLMWKNPNDINFLGVQIVRNPGSLPVNPYDGTIIFRGRSDFFDDNNLRPDTRYFYGLFAFNWENKFSTSTSFISIKTLATDEYVPVPEKPAAATMMITTLVSTAELIENLKLKIQELQQKVVLLRIQLLREKIEGLQKKVSELRGEVLPQVQSIPEVHTVRVESGGFYPPELIIRRHDTVRWDNFDSKSAWPASDNHPQHLIYPEFDSLKGIFRGESYSFTFSKIGTWRYHDHLDATRVGTIIVK